MDRAELSDRLTSVTRRELARVAAAIKPPVWRRAALAKALRADLPELRDAIACLGARDWNGAHDALSGHFASRPARFVIAPSRRGAVAEAIATAFPSARSSARRLAEPLLDGRFDLLGYSGLRWPNSSSGDGRSIDWHLDPVHGLSAPRAFWTRVPYLDPACGDHKIIWELNRHQYWMKLGRAYWLTGDARYRSTFVEHLASWMRANPPLVGINWASMLELGLRSISWLWALHLFVSPDRTAMGRDAGELPWTVDLLLGLDRQLRLVEHNLSRYFSPNTHLLGEALALYVVGRALPELRRAHIWERVGRDVLIEQISKQINADGGHAELSTHYHRYTLDFYLLALAVARATADDAAAPFEKTVAALAGFARGMADDRGHLPCFGDEDGGLTLPICGRRPYDVSDSLQVAAQLIGQPALAIGTPAEEVVWMTGQVPAARELTSWPSMAFRDSGYFVSRTRGGNHLTIDAGPHGFLNGGHAHSDALSITLSVRGRPLFIDPGTGCYTIDRAVRDRFRSTVSHNTLTLNGESHSSPDGPFHWQSTADARVLDWRSPRTFDYFEGAHDGYSPLVHHRTILSRPGCWWIIDRVSGAGHHRADVHWHLAPSWRATASQRRVYLESSDGAAAWLLSPGDDFELLSGATDESGIGWCSPVYGSIVPTATVRASRVAQVPFAMVTVVVDAPADEEPHVETVPVTLNERLDTQAIGVRLTAAGWTETVLFSAPIDPVRGIPPRRAMRRIGRIETDARVMCWRDDDGHDQDAAPAVLIDGTLARRHSATAARRLTTASDALERDARSALG
jgi:hypothetical protein